MAETHFTPPLDAQILACSSEALLILLKGSIDDEAALMDDVLSLSISDRQLFTETAPQATAMFSVIGRVLEDGQTRALIYGVLGELSKRLKTGVPA